MSTLKSGFVLLDDEKLVMEVEAELWASSSDPISQVLGNLKKAFSKILGYKIKSFLIITDKRVIEVKTEIACWCINTGKHVKYVVPNAVKEVGYTKVATCGAFCPRYDFYYDSHTQHTSVMLKGVDEAGAKKVADAFYAAISNAQ